jgi:DinB superfamily
MDATARRIVWGQFGAAIDMLENAIRACPDQLWSDRDRQPEFWYIAYHTLFYLDLYLGDATDGFVPPAPFTLSEIDPAGLLPDRVYEKHELLAYLEHGRAKARTRIAAISGEAAHERCHYRWVELTRLESLFYNMRHVQHHAAQLNLLLRQSTNSAPGWVTRTASDS